MKDLVGLIGKSSCHKNALDAGLREVKAWNHPVVLPHFPHLSVSQEGLNQAVHFPCDSVFDEGTYSMVKVYYDIEYVILRKVVEIFILKILIHCIPL